MKAAELRHPGIGCHLSTWNVADHVPDAAVGMLWRHEEATTRDSQAKSAHPAARFATETADGVIIHNSNGLHESVTNC